MSPARCYRFACQKFSDRSAPGRNGWLCARTSLNAAAMRRATPTEAMKPMTENQRQVIRHCSHRLRSRLTYVILYLHTLNSVLHDGLSRELEQEFRKTADVPEATRKDLNALLREIERLPKRTGFQPAINSRRSALGPESKNGA